MNRFIPILLATLFLSLILSPTGAAAKKEIQLRGAVRDSNGDPVSSVDILIVDLKRQGKPIVIRTNDDGKYHIALQEMDAFDLFYDHVDAGRAAVMKLSGKHDQDITIILFPAKQISNMTARQVFSEIQAYEYAMFLARFEEPENPELITQIKKLGNAKKIADRLDKLRQAKIKGATKDLIIKQLAGVKNEYMKFNR